MSYILDALKKADAEREQGTVPGLHSQPRAPVPDDNEPPARATVPVVWIGAGVALSVIALLSWQLWTRDGATTGTAAVVAPPTQDMGTVQDAAPANAQTQPPMAPPTPRLNVPPDQPPPPSRVAEVVPLAPAPHIAPARPAAPPTATMQPDQGSVTRPASTHVPALSELPEEVRREVPVLTVGGAMYSDTPASRMVVLNGQVFHEGDQPVPGLVLEEIKLKSAIFKYKGYRYSVHY